MFVCLPDQKLQVTNILFKLNAIISTINATGLLFYTLVIWYLHRSFEFRPSVIPMTLRRIRAEVAKCPVSLVGLMTSLALEMFRNGTILEARVGTGFTQISC